MKITKLLTSITLAAVCTFVFDTNAFSAGVTEITLYQNASDTDNTVNAEIEAWYGEIPSTDDYGNPLTAPTRTGYVFTGYYDARHGGTQYYYPDMTSDKFFTGQSMLALYAHWIPITIASNESNPTCDNDTVGATSGDTALDAVWNANTLNLKFMANGQEFASNTCTYGQNITIPTTTPTRTGYNFTGWVVHSDE